MQGEGEGKGKGKGEMGDEMNGCGRRKEGKIMK